MNIPVQELPGLLSDFLQRNKLEKPFHDCLKQFHQEVRKDPSLLTLCAYTHETLFGYQEYITRKRFQKNITLNLLEKKPYLYTFISVIIGLDRLQKMVSKEIGDKYLKRYKDVTLKCRKFPPTLHEINTFISFLNKGFVCVDIPDQESNPGKKVDFIFIKNNQKFFAECKYVSRYAGHPIILENANIIISNIDQSLYENLPNHSMIEITFDKKLTTKGDKDDEYSPEKLLEKINNRFKEEDIRINYVTSIDLPPQSTTMEEQIEFLRRNHTNQSHIFFKKNIAKKSLHYIRLTSTVPNLREQLIQDRIKESFEKKTEGYPLIICLWLDSMIDSNLITYKDKLNKMMESSLNSVTPSNRPVMIWIMSDMEAESTQTLWFNGFKKKGYFVTKFNKEFESYINFFPDLTLF